MGQFVVRRQNVIRGMAYIRLVTFECRALPLSLSEVTIPVPGFDPGGPSGECDGRTKSWHAVIG
jgi:hypothetical protein